MTETPKPALGDPDIYPSDEVLAVTLGPARAAFDAVLARTLESCPDAAFQWKYYRDGKSWLMNASRKKKTLFWLSADRLSFRTTFYLPSSTEDAVLGGPFPAATKDGFAASAGKKFRGATAGVSSAADVEAFAALLAIKLTVL